SVIVYPNPFSDNTTFVIQSDKLNEIYSFELTDVLGKKVKSKNGISEKQFEISRNGLENGIYFYKIYTSESVVGIGKVVIK
ncbi:MAG TPA: T9SS type A sorting domain-containing protein, partial [Bacteroidia bacterium]|nr:T9SS type A sorting domain-containing protein [Bacteroidia bacterium]